MVVTASVVPLQSYGYSAYAAPADTKAEPVPVAASIVAAAPNRLLALPRDVTLLVLGFLSLQGVGAMSRLSRQWKSMLWSHIRTLDLSNTYLDDAVADQLVQQFNPTNLTLAGSRMTWTSFDRMITAFTRLKTLNARHLGARFLYQNIDQINTKLYGLEHLDLTGTNLTPFAPQLMGDFESSPSVMPGANTLDRWFRDVTSRTGNAPAAGLELLINTRETGILCIPTLRSITFGSKNRWNVGTRGLRQQAIAFAGMPKLEEFNMADMAVEFFPQPRALRTLRLHNVQIPYALNARVLTQYTNLRTLVLTGITLAGTKFNASERKAREFARLSSLDTSSQAKDEKKDAAGAATPAPPPILTFFEHFPSLTYLDMSDSSEVQDDTILALSTHCRALTTLKLNRVWEVTSASFTGDGQTASGRGGGGFGPIAKLTELRVLELSGYLEQRSFHLDGFLPLLAAGCRNLVSLSLHSRPTLTVPTIVDFVHAATSTLTSIDLRHCVRIDTNERTVLDGFLLQRSRGVWDEPAAARKALNELMSAVVKPAGIKLVRLQPHDYINGGNLPAPEFDEKGASKIWVRTYENSFDRDTKANYREREVADRKAAEICCNRTVIYCQHTKLALVPCACGLLVHPNARAEHEETVCTHAPRSRLCPASLDGCTYRGSVLELQKHVPTCPAWKIACRTLWCRQLVPRSEYAAHTKRHADQCDRPQVGYMNAKFSAKQTEAVLAANYRSNIFAPVSCLVSGVPKLDITRSNSAPIAAAASSGDSKDEKSGTGAGTAANQNVDMFTAVKHEWRWRALALAQRRVYVCPKCLFHIHDELLLEHSCDPRIPVCRPHFLEVGGWWNLKSTPPAAYFPTREDLLDRFAAPRAPPNGAAAPVRKWSGNAWSASIPWLTGGTALREQIPTLNLYPTNEIAVLIDRKWVAVRLDQIMPHWAKAADRKYEPPVAPNGTATTTVNPYYDPERVATLADPNPPAPTPATAADEKKEVPTVATPIASAASTAAAPAADSKIGPVSDTKVEPATATAAVPVIAPAPIIPRAASIPGIAPDAPPAPDAPNQTEQLPIGYWTDATSVPVAPAAAAAAAAAAAPSKRQSSALPPIHVKQPIIESAESNAVAAVLDGLSVPEAPTAPEAPVAPASFDAPPAAPPAPEWDESAAASLAAPMYPLLRIPPPNPVRPTGGAALGRVMPARPAPEAPPVSAATAYVRRVFQLDDDLGDFLTAEAKRREANWNGATGDAAALNARVRAIRIATGSRSVAAIDDFLSLPHTTITVSTTTTTTIASEFGTTTEVRTTPSEVVWKGPVPLTLGWQLPSLEAGQRRGRGSARSPWALPPVVAELTLAPPTAAPRPDDVTPTHVTPTVTIAPYRFFAIRNKN